MKKALYLSFLLLAACAKNVPVYTYENAHVVDDALQKTDTCIIIDNEKTVYEKGVEQLSTNPFLGSEGYSASSVKKTKRTYENAFENTSCKNPITIRRDIKVAAIVFPGTCSERVYAGSYNAGSTTYSSGYTNYYGGYSGTSNTITNTIPVYNTRNYACMKENYLTEIEFYQDSNYIGKIRNKYWEDTNSDYTIDVFTEEFIKLLQKSSNK